MLRHRAREIGCIPAHFDLLDDRLPVGVQKLHRILDGDYVIVTMCIHQIQQRGQRGAFSAAGGPRHQHQSLPRFRQRRSNGGRFSDSSVGMRLGQQPQAPRQGSALIMDVRAEAADAFPMEAQIHRAVALQFLGLRGSQHRQ